MKLNHDFKYGIGAIVYLKTDRDQLQRLVVGYRIRGNTEVVYDLQHSDDEVTSHYDFEISGERDVLMTSTN